jgi:hypothetical protein
VCALFFINFAKHSGSDEDADSVNDLGGGDSRSEYKLLRATIKDTLDIVPSKDSRFRSLKNIIYTAKSYGFFFAFYFILFYFYSIQINAIFNYNISIYKKICVIKILQALNGKI